MTGPSVRPDRVAPGRGRDRPPATAWAAPGNDPADFGDETTQLHYEFARDVRPAAASAGDGPVVGRRWELTEPGDDDPGFAGMSPTQRVGFAAAVGQYRRHRPGWLTDPDAHVTAPAEQGAAQVAAWLADPNWRPHPDAAANWTAPRSPVEAMAVESAARSGLGLFTPPPAVSQERMARGVAGWERMTVRYTPGQAPGQQTGPVDG